MLRISRSALDIIQHHLFCVSVGIAQEEGGVGFVVASPGVLPGMQANALSDQRDEINHHHRGGWLLGSGGGLAGDISQKTLTFSL
ncbi:hypothetical protein, partial [Acetobacter sp. DsW_059]|uniref:hypothetical protein n=1 Tax=Acetobacter sp. DsW_059 TaxID=1670661 RepID=UPI001E3ED751